jgi:CheY-like chemotaxis protein
MDIKMPHIDGLKATKRIRKYYSQTRQDKTAPFIIAVTASTNDTIDSVKDECTTAGMDAYINRPITVADLAKVLNESYNLDRT